MAEYIIKIVLDKSKRELFGKRIREVIKKNFDWESIIERYVKVYDSIR